MSSEHVEHALGFLHVPAPFTSPASVSSYCVGFHSSERVNDRAYDELLGNIVRRLWTIPASHRYCNSIFTDIAAVDTGNAVYVNRVTSLHAELVRDE